MFGKILAILSAMLLVACVNKKYGDPANYKDGHLESTSEVCQARFNSGHCVQLTWELMPTDSDFGSFLFKIFRSNPDGSMSAEDLGGEMAVVLWMPGMGHGSSPVSVERVGVGSYRAANVFFTMRGRWEIRFQARENLHVKDQAIITIHL